MPTTSLWLNALGVVDAVLEGVSSEGGDLIVAVRPKARRRHRCPHCGRRAAGFDEGGGRRRWRTLDVGSSRTFVEAAAPRIQCSDHGVVVASVPWAEHGARCTRAYEDQAAWLAARMDLSAVAQLMRMSWRSVGSILERVAGRMLESQADLLDGLRRIGIDEISYRKGQRYLLVVVNHDSGRLVWAGPGRNAEAVDRFFFALGPERSRQIEVVTADAADWIHEVVRTRCPNATICMDPFHVVQWALAALDQVRRDLWNQLRRAHGNKLARPLRNTRWALWKNAQNLNSKQQDQLAWIEETNQPLFRAYLLKEHLRLVFQLPAVEAEALLMEWLGWALDSELDPFVRLANSVIDYLRQILASIRLRMSNGLVEAINTRLRLISRRAYGFHSHRPLVGLAFLTVGGLCPALPGRA
ncbi:MAG TPA: ISL3 family transposase [Candidatus Dormibacteraeota bacterium]